MTPPVCTGWRELLRVTRSSCPKLFYALDRSDDSFTIRLTDLVAIWGCSLDQAAIIDYARAKGSSIDPSESSTQLRVLLDKLEQSLGAGDNRLVRSDNDETQWIFLETHLELPKPLKPLVWLFKLEPKDAGELAEQLLRPCLQEASVAKQMIESLLRVIKDKDHVLSRLLERVESSATDLSMIFPGITGLRSRKGRVTSAEAQRHVPGMAEFDHDKWTRTFESDSPYSGFHQMGMGNLIVGCERCPKHTVQQHNNWFNRLPVRGSNGEISISDRNRPNVKGMGETSSPVAKSSETQSDFETQATPPRLRKRGRVGAGERDNLSDFDHEERRSAKKTKIGRIGGHVNRKRTVSPMVNPSSSPAPETSEVNQQTRNSTAQSTKRITPVNSGSETETASETELPPSRSTGKPLNRASLSPSPSPSPSPPAKAPPRPPPIRRLGRLNSSLSEQRPSSSSSSKSPDPSPPRSKTAHFKPRDNTSHSQRSQHVTTTVATVHDRTTTPTTTSNPSTPRKLGRLSQRHGSHSTTTTPSKDKHRRVSTVDETTRTPPGKAKDVHNDTDTESGSGTGSPTPSSKRHERVKPTGNGSDEERGKVKPEDPERSGSAVHRSTADADENVGGDANGNGDVKEKPARLKETVEQAADRRREELKQRLHTGAGVGTRKKRKF